MEKCNRFSQNKYSYLLFYTILFVLFNSTKLTSQIWDWGVQIKTTPHSFFEQLHCAIDPLGYIIVVGEQFDEEVIDGISLNNGDGYMIKYGPDGTLIWAKPLKTTNQCSSDSFEPKVIKTDNNGNIYVGSVCGGGICCSNIVISKYDPQGNELMTLVSTGEGSGIISDIYVDAAGGMIVTGESLSSVNQQNVILGGASVIGQKSFVFKLDPNGIAEWVYTLPSESDFGFDMERVTTDLSGNIYLVGITMISGNLGNGVSVSVDGFTGGLLFVVKLNSDGVPQWAKVSTSNSVTFSNADKIGDVYYDSARESLLLFGTYKNAFKWDMNQVPGNGFFGQFLLGLDSSGEFKFLNYIKDSAEALSGGGQMLVEPISGDIYVSHSAGNSILDSITVNLNCDGIGGYVAAFDNEGIGKWIIGTNCLSSDPDFFVHGAALDPNGDIYVVGQLNSAVFGIDTISTNTSQGGVPILAKLLRKEASLYGKVFRDFNGNGLVDLEDNNLEGIILQSSPLQLRALSNTNGIYQFGVNLESHEITLPFLPQHHMIVSPINNNHIVTTASAGQVLSGLDFALQPIPNIHDLEIELTPLNAVRPGFTTHYEIRCANVGSTIQNGSIQFDHSEILTFSNSSIPANSIDPANLNVTFELGDINPYQDTSIVVSFIVSTNTLGDSVINNVEILPVVGDVEPLDNQKSLSQIVTGSFDPNDKQALSGSSITPEEVAAQIEIDYLIRFQNTGTDTAFTVIVKDSFPDNLEMSSFRMVDASHEYSLSINSNNILSWRFDNILLPDSTTNEPASHGFVRFRVTPKTDLSLGEIIENQASIFFDYNEPIITNLSEVIVEFPTSVQQYSNKQPKVLIFPNPSSGRMNISLHDIYEGELIVSLFNALGSEVLHKNFSLNDTGNSFNLDLNHLSSGTYFLILDFGDHRSIKRWVKN